MTLHIDVITSFVENLNMRVISTAVNTYSSIGMHDYPTTIEITLSKSTVATKSNSYESFINQTINRIQNGRLNM